MFHGKQIIFTDMGRTAFQIIIEKMNLRNSDMLIPAYICDIFFPIIKKYNISPVLIDIDLATFNLNTQNIEESITPNTKSILVPHIYGLQNNIKSIQSIAKKHNLKVIEDCAHAFGVLPARILPLAKSARAGDKKIFVGNFGDAALFSLYKIFPCFRGGMLICPKHWKINLQKTSFSFRDFISFLNCFSFCAYLFKKFGQEIAPKMIRKEKIEQFGKMNNVSLNLFFFFLKQWKQKREKRIKLALLFQGKLKDIGFDVQKSENNSFGYVSALMPKNLENKRDLLVAELKNRKIFCTRMWHTPLALNPFAQKEYNIDVNKFPNTAEAGRRIVNFPLQDFYEKKDIEKMINVLVFVFKKIRAQNPD